MNKKKFYVISTCCLIAVLIVFEIVMYYFVGASVLLEKGKMRTFWIGFPTIIVVLSFIRDFVIMKKYANQDNNKE